VSNAPIAWIIEVSKQSKAEPSFCTEATSNDEKV
jgi:hypothetical protein